MEKLRGALVVGPPPLQIDRTGLRGGGFGEGDASHTPMIPCGGCVEVSPHCLILFLLCNKHVSRGVLTVSDQAERPLEAFALEPRYLAQGSLLAKAARGPTVFWRSAFTAQRRALSRGQPGNSHIFSVAQMCIRCGTAGAKETPTRAAPTHILARVAWLPFQNQAAFSTDGPVASSPPVLGSKLQIARHYLAMAPFCFPTACLHQRLQPPACPRR